jgi:hypothetical protein
MESGYRRISSPDAEIVAVVDSSSYCHATPNLGENEMKVARLWVEDCPMKDSCVTLVQKRSRICKHVGPFDIPDGLTQTFRKIRCKFGHEDNQKATPKRVMAIEPDNCPKEFSNCLGCKFLYLVDIGRCVSLEKSHAFVVCGYSR